MAMSPRKMMAMGKNGEKKTKSAVKLRGGGMVKKMKDGGAAKAPTSSPRPRKRPDDLMEGFALRSSSIVVVVVVVFQTVRDPITQPMQCRHGLGLIALHTGVFQRSIQQGTTDFRQAPPLIL